MIVGQIQVVQNIHYRFTYMDFEGQSYAFLSDFILQPKWRSVLQNKARDCMLKGSV